MKILFLHGWQSVPGGVKPTYLKDHGHEVINPMLPDEDFNLAIKIAQAEFDRHQPQVVVGSSRGGAVALIVRLGPDSYDDALLEPHVREFDINGRPMKGWVLVEPDGVGGDEQLKGWIERALKFVGKLPAK